MKSHIQNTGRQVETGQKTGADPLATDAANTILSL